MRASSRSDAGPMLCASLVMASRRLKEIETVQVDGAGRMKRCSRGVRRMMKSFFVFSQV